MFLIGLMNCRLEFVGRVWMLLVEYGLVVWCLGFFGCGGWFDDGVGFELVLVLVRGYVCLVGV